jgi:hypothetical protein
MSTHRPTAREILNKLSDKSLRKSTISRFMQQLTRKEQRELRRLVKENFDFYRRLRQLVGIYRTTASQKRSQRRKLSKLPYSIDSSGSARWKFADGTRGISLGGPRLLIPTVQRTKNDVLYLDLRIWYYREDDETMTVYPSRKGVTIPLDCITELRNRLTALDVRRKVGKGTDA